MKSEIGVDCSKCKCQSALGARNIFEFHETCENYKYVYNMYMFTADTFAHGKQTSTFAFHCSVNAKRLPLRHTILAITKQ